MLFARAPQRGRVKTRLVPPLTAHQALALHLACLEATARLLASLPNRIHRFLYLTGTPRRARRSMRRLGLPAAVTVRTQRGRDLGARLERMFRELFAAGYERVLVIGSDTPTLPRTRLLEALASLRRVEVVVGPTEDGGYYLIGCRRSPLPDIFRGIPWGTAQTFARTRARLRRTRVRFRVLPRWYDVDRPADLARLAREVARARPIRARASHLRPLQTYFTRRRDGHSIPASRRPARGRHHRKPPPGRV